MKINLLLPPAYAVRRRVMFSQMCACSGGGGNPATGPRSLPNLWSWVLSWGSQVSSLVSGPRSFFFGGGGSPVLSRSHDQGTPSPHSGLGYSASGQVTRRWYASCGFLQEDFLVVNKYWYFSKISACLSRQMIWKLTWLKANSTRHGRVLKYSPCVLNGKLRVFIFSRAVS